MKRPVRCHTSQMNHRPCHDFVHLDNVKLTKYRTSHQKCSRVKENVTNSLRSLYQTHQQQKSKLWKCTKSARLAKLTAQDLRCSYPQQLLLSATLTVSYSDSQLLDAQLLYSQLLHRWLLYCLLLYSQLLYCQLLCCQLLLLSASLTVSYSTLSYSTLSNSTVS